MKLLGHTCDRIAWGLSFAYAVTLIVSGHWLHPIEDPYGPEFDGYLACVDELREGRLPKDAYRPLLYPIVSTLPAMAVGNSFLGAKIASAFSGGLAVLATYFLGASVFGRRIGLFGAVLLATNRHFVQASYRAATDIVFCATIALMLLFFVKLIRSGRVRDLLLTSLFFSLSFFTRYVAVFFLPVLFGGFLLRRDFPFRKRVAFTALFPVFAFVFLIPHFGLQTLSFGDPFYNENWRNITFKFSGLRDTEAFTGSEESGVVEVLTESPRTTFKSWINELRKLVFYNFMNLNGRNTAGAFFTVLLALGVLSVVPTRNPKILALVLALGSYLLILCFFWFFESRFALPILPLCYLLIANFILRSSLRGRLSLFGWRVQKRHFLACLFLLLNLQATRVNMLVFIDNHPIQEVLEAIQLQKEHGKDLVVLGTYWATGRYVDYSFLNLPLPTGEPARSAAAYLNRSREEMKTLGTTHLIFGKKTHMGRPEGLLTGEGVPNYLRMIKRNEHVTIYAFDRSKL